MSQGPIVDRDPLLEEARALTASPAAVSRAWARLESTPARRFAVWWLAPFAVAAVVALVVLSHRPVPQRSTDFVAVAAGQRLALTGIGGEAELIGPGRATVESGILTLLDGTVRGSAFEVRAGHARVRAGKSSLVEVRIMSSHVVVAAYRGEALVDWGDGHAVAIVAGMRSDGEKVEAMAPAPEPSAVPTPAVSAAPPAATPALSPPTTRAEASPRPSAPRVAKVEPAPAAVAPTPAPAPVPDLIEQENALVSTAIAALHKRHDPKAALVALAEHDSKFPDGVLGREAALVRIEALLADHQRDAALRALDHLGDDLPRVDLRIARAELRAEHGRPTDALTDFSRVLQLHASNELLERAQWGSAVCRARSGDAAGARREFAEYVRSFPEGPHRAEAQRALDGE